MDFVVTLRLTILFLYFLIEYKFSLIMDKDMYW